MKKLIIVLVLLMLLPGVMASGVTRSFSSDSVNPGDTLSVTLDVVVDGGETFYLIDETYPSTSWNVVDDGSGDADANPPHIFWTVLSSASSTSYTYQLTVPDQPGIYSFSGESAFEGGSEENILGDTQITVLDDSGEPPIIIEDDLMVNYVRGVIEVDGEPADAGTVYHVEVLSGDNEGYVFSGSVDEDVPSDFEGVGYFDTMDVLGFSTGRSFSVSVEDMSCTANDVFVNGGNGDFNDVGSLINLDCDDTPNVPPVIDSISDINVDEDSGVSAGVVLSADDVDGSIDSFSVIDENVDEVDCTISDSLLNVRPADDFFGVASCTVEVEDNRGGTDSMSFDIIVANINDAPEIVSVTPVSDSPIITEDGSQEFSIEWEDIDNPDAEVFVEWFVEGVDTGVIGEEFEFVASGDGEYDVEVRVSDLDEEVSYEWVVTSSSVPIADGFNGDTTDFTGMDDDDLMSVNLILEVLGIGRIEFLEPVDLRDVVDFNNFVEISTRGIGIDSDFYNLFRNAPARITFYNLPFSEIPEILYNGDFVFGDGSTCPGSVCKNLIYENNDLSFEVDGFSTFSISDPPTCSELGGDICSANEVCGGSEISSSSGGVCCSIACTEVPIGLSDAPQCDFPSSSLSINIKDPDKGDDFEVGEIIGVDVEVENDFDEKMDFEVEVHLYNLDEDESEEDAEEDNIDIKSGKDESVEFELEIPYDIDEGDDYVIYAFVEDEDGNFCNSDSVELDIEREEDALRIDDLSINPLNALAGEKVYITTKVLNIGSDDQDDIYIEIVSEELGLNLRSEEFSLEEFDDDDDTIVEMQFTIPDNAEVGAYDLEVRAVFSGDDVEETVSVFVKDSFFDGSGSIFLGGDSSLDLGGKDSSNVISSGKTITLGRVSDGEILFRPSTRTINLRDENTKVIERNDFVFEETRVEKNYYWKNRGFYYPGKYTLGRINSPLLWILFLILDLVLFIGIVIFFVKLVFWRAR